MLVLFLFAFSHPGAATASRQLERRAEELAGRIERLFDAGRYGEAVAEARALISNQIELFGLDDEEVAYCRNLLGNLLRLADRPRKAVPHHELALAFFEPRRASHALEIAQSIEMLGVAWLAAGHLDKAGPLLEGALDAIREARGSQHRDTAHSLNSLGYLRFLQGRYEEAEALYEQSLQIHRHRLGTEHPNTVAVRVNIALLREDRGDLKGARNDFKEIAEATGRLFGVDHPETARRLADLARLDKAFGDLDSAELGFSRALAISEEVAGSNHPDRRRYLAGLGSVARARGEFEVARDLFAEALRLTEVLHGPQHPDTANALTNLGTVLEDLGELEEAAVLHERALDIDQRYFGGRHPRMAATLNNLGTVRETMGELSLARSLHTEALAIREAFLGPSHPDVAVSLTNLGHAVHALGDLPYAEALYLRALDIRGGYFGLDHPKTAASQNNLAAVLRSRGNLLRARELYESALAVREKLLGPNHPSTAGSLTNLGLLEADLGRPVRALAYLSRAYGIRRKAHGPNHPEVATVINNLAPLFRVVGDVEAEYQYHRTAYELRLNALGGSHPATASSLHNMGSVERRRGRLKESRRDLEKALALRVEILGQAHPDTAATLLALAVTELSADKNERALALTERAAETSERWVSSVLTLGTEIEKRLFLRTVNGMYDWSVYLHRTLVSAGAREATRQSSKKLLARSLRLAAKAILRAKGRALEEAAASRRRLLGQLGGEDRGRFNRLAELRQEQAALIIQRPQGLELKRARGRLTELSREIREIELQLVRRSAAFRQARGFADSAKVCRALPSASALIEIFQYQPFDQSATGNPWGKKRYAALVLTPSGPSAILDLGVVDRIDKQIQSFRDAVVQRDPAIRDLGRILYDELFAKIHPLVSDAEALLIAPDGAFHLLPFAALSDGDGRLLLEQFRISYLGTGREMLSTSEAPIGPAGEPPLIVGAPDFETVDLSWPRVVRREHSGDGLPATFDPLAGARAEVGAIGQLLSLGEGRILCGPRATEVALKNVRGPRILHLATHGFFLPGLEVEESGAADYDLLSDRARETELGAFVRSGLALAGYNHRYRAPGGNDGVLTALEVMELDLVGTELVVFSACDTGLGELRSGRGVFGLRRALVLAGARSQLLSLWQVEDPATEPFMVSFYGQLLAGIGRAEALRRTQLAALHGEPLPGLEGLDEGSELQHLDACAAKQEASEVAERGVAVVGELEEGVRPAWLQHPYYWAAFVLSGDTGPVAWSSPTAP